MLEINDLEFRRTALAQSTSNSHFQSRLLILQLKYSIKNTKRENHQKEEVVQFLMISLVNFSRLCEGVCCFVWKN